MSEKNNGPQTWHGPGELAERREQDVTRVVINRAVELDHCLGRSDMLCSEHQVYGKQGGENTSVVNVDDASISLACSGVRRTGIRACATHGTVLTSNVRRRTCLLAVCSRFSLVFETSATTISATKAFEPTWARIVLQKRRRAVGFADKHRRCWRCARPETAVDGCRCRGGSAEKCPHRERGRCGATEAWETRQRAR